MGRALDAVLRGELVVGAGVAGRMRAAVTRGRENSPFPQLTEREVELLDLVARGLDNSAIASRLFLAEKTVRNRVSGVFGKLGAPNRSAAIALARDAGLGSDAD